MIKTIDKENKLKTGAIINESSFMVELFFSSAFLGETDEYSTDFKDADVLISIVDDDVVFNFEFSIIFELGIVDVGKSSFLAVIVHIQLE